MCTAWAGDGSGSDDAAPISSMVPRGAIGLTGQAPQIDTLSTPAESDAHGVSRAGGDGDSLQATADAETSSERNYHSPK